MLTINKYNDVIIMGDYLKVKWHLENYNKNDYPVVFKTRKLSNVQNFQFLCLKNGYNIYVNDIAYKKCPHPVNGEMNGSMVIITVEDDENTEYCILVNTKYGENKFSFPCGLRVENEDFKTCAIREIQEEIGILLDKNLLKEYGVYSKNYVAYDEVWLNVTYMYRYHIKTTIKSIENILKNFKSNDEILSILYLEKSEIENLKPFLENYEYYIVQKIFGQNVSPPIFENIINLNIY